MTAAQACPHTYFIAGTDTGIGKTFVTALLLRTAHLSGLRALGMKMCRRWWPPATCR